LEHQLGIELLQDLVEQSVNSLQAFADFSIYLAFLVHLLLLASLCVLVQ